jgi:hypothetical protein
MEEIIAAKQPDHRQKDEKCRETKKKVHSYDESEKSLGLAGRSCF